MVKKRSRQNGTYKVPAGVVKQELYKDKTLYLKNYRSYTASGDRKHGISESIIYETGRGGSFRPCTHDKVNHGDPIKKGGFLQYGTPSNPALWSGVTVSIVEGLHEYACRQMPELSTLSGYVDSRDVGSIPWDELSAQAYSAMKPKINIDGNSLLNFIYEIKDFKHLAQSIQKRLFRGGSVQGIWDAIIGRPKKRRHKSTLRDLAGMNLSYQFGWRPFADDCWHLYRTISNFNKRWNEFKHRAGLPISRHYSTVVTGTSLGQSLLYSNNQGMPVGFVGGYDPRCYIRIYRSSDSGIQYSANMRYKYELPDDAVSVMGAVKAAMDSLGVRVNPRIIWDAIPFSFLIDWVTNIGKLLDRFSVDNLQIRVRVSEFCHSAKRTMVLVAKTQQNYMEQGVYKYFPEQVVKTVQKSYYYRVLGMPNIPGALITRAPGPNQLGLAASLVLTR